jgi:hypothetical protein
MVFPGPACDGDDCLVGDLRDKWQQLEEAGLFSQNGKDFLADGLELFVLLFQLGVISRIRANIETLLPKREVLGSGLGRDGLSSELNSESGNGMEAIEKRRNRNSPLLGHALTPSYR